MFDIFNKKALKAEREFSATLRDARDAAEAQLAERKKRDAESSSIVFYFDKELTVSMETDVNPLVIDKLVAEGYIAERDISNEDAIHLAFVLIASEVTESIIGQYEGRTFDEGEPK